MTAPTSPHPVTAGLTELVAGQREQLEADLAAGRLAEQRHQYLDLDADSACCPSGFTCPACPPNDTPGETR